MSLQRRLQMFAIDRFQQRQVVIHPRRAAFFVRILHGMGRQGDDRYVLIRRLGGTNLASCRPCPYRSTNRPCRWAATALIKLLSSCWVLPRSNTVKRTPSNLARPSCVPSHRWPSAVCATSSTVFCGGPCTISQLLSMHRVRSLAGSKAKALPPTPPSAMSATQRAAREISNAAQAFDSIHGQAARFSCQDTPNLSFTQPNL